MPSFRSVILSAAAAGIAMAETHVVKVGENGNTFDPKMLTAAVGDKVEFHFWPRNHSVVAGSMTEGCTPLDSNGFYSGFIPSQSGMADDMFVIDITSEDPWVYYCSQASHCQVGMWGMINGDDSMAADYKTLVEAATDNLSPSEAGPFGGEVVAMSESGSTTGADDETDGTDGTDGEGTEGGDSGAGMVVASMGMSFAAFAAAVLLS